MRLMAPSYFCNCWNVTPTACASCVCVRPASSRRGRNREATWRSTAFGRRSDINSTNRAGAAYRRQNLAGLRAKCTMMRRPMKKAPRRTAGPRINAVSSYPIRQRRANSQPTKKAPAAIRDRGPVIQKDLRTEGSPQCNRAPPSLAQVRAPGERCQPASTIVSLLLDQ